VGSADPSLPALSLPLYLLVNSNTASAAEVFTAALRENEGGRGGAVSVVGEQTFGKGLIQTLLPLEALASEDEQAGVSGVAVTVARYETPLRHDINKVGISVDIPVSCDDKSEGSIQKCLANFL
jgi:carboxyl-terminal processing protease